MNKNLPFSSSFFLSALEKWSYIEESYIIPIEQELHVDIQNSKVNVNEGGFYYTSSYPAQ